MISKYQLDTAIEAALTVIATMGVVVLAVLGGVFTIAIMVLPWAAICWAISVVLGLLHANVGLQEAAAILICVLLLASLLRPRAA